MISAIFWFQNKHFTAYHLFGYKLDSSLSRMKWSKYSVKLIRAKDFYLEMFICNYQSLVRYYFRSVQNSSILLIHSISNFTNPMTKTYPSKMVKKCDGASTICFPSKQKDRQQSLTFKKKIARERERDFHCKNWNVECAEMRAQSFQYQREYASLKLFILPREDNIECKHFGFNSCSKHFRINEKQLTHSINEIDTIKYEIIMRWLSYQIVKLRKTLWRLLPIFPDKICVNKWTNVIIWKRSGIIPKKKNWKWYQRYLIWKPSLCSLSSL